MPSIKEKVDICLIGYNVEDTSVDYILSQRNLGMALVASSLRNSGFTVDFINPLIKGLSVEETAGEAEKKEYKYMGFSVLDSIGFEYVKKVIIKLREMGYKQHFTVGGFFPTINYRNVFSGVPDGLIDTVCRGEGEIMTLELFKALECGEDWREIEGIAYMGEDGIVANPMRPYISDLDSILFAADDEVKDCIARKQPINLFSSRGCYGNCTYCSSHKLFYGREHNKWRSRSARSVVDEMEMLAKRFDARCFSFMDDNFIGPGEMGRRRVVAICEEIRARGMDIEFFFECRPDGISDEVAKALSKAGCKLVFLGIESGSDNCLKELGRGNINKETNREAISILADNHIEVTIGFIMFTPECTFEDLKDNIDLLKFYFTRNYRSYLLTMKIGTLLFSGLVPISGSQICARLEKEVRVTGDELEYVSTSSEVELLRLLLQRMHIYKYVDEMEAKIRKEWYDPDLWSGENQGDRLASVKEYERELINMCSDLFFELMDSIKSHDLRNINRIVLKFKRKLLVFTNEKIKQIRNILNNSEVRNGYERVG